MLLIVHACSVARFDFTCMNEFQHVFPAIGVKRQVWFRLNSCVASSVDGASRIAKYHTRPGQKSGSAPGGMESVNEGDSRINQGVLNNSTRACSFQLVEWNFISCVHTFSEDTVLFRHTKCQGFCTWPARLKFCQDITVKFSMHHENLHVVRMSWTTPFIKTTPVHATCYTGSTGHFWLPMFIT